MTLDRTLLPRRALGRLAGTLALTVAGIAPHSGAFAQAYPNKAIRLIVPYAVGGSTDLTARLIAKSLSTRLGQPVIVDNRAGAGGAVGHDAVAKAPADGYTLLFSAAGPLTVTPHTYAKLPYDPVKGFEPITLVATQPLLLVVKPGLSVNSVADLVREAQAKPGKLSYGSFGTGSAAHLAGEYFKTLAKVDMVHVPYKGSGPALVDLVGGQIDLMFDVFSTAAPLVKSGKLRPLAVTGKARSPVLPQLPTVAESGLPGYEVYEWNAVFVPAGTPQAVVDRLAKEFSALLKEPGIRQRLEATGAEVVAAGPAELDAFRRAEIAKWGQLARAHKIQMD